MIIPPYPKPTKCYGDTVIRRYGVLKRLTLLLKRLTLFLKRLINENCQMS